MVFAFEEPAIWYHEFCHDSMGKYRILTEFTGDTAVCIWLSGSLCIRWDRIHRMHF